jgi:hypothetical protein
LRNIVCVTKAMIWIMISVGCCPHLTERKWQHIVGKAMHECQCKSFKEPGLNSQPGVSVRQPYLLYRLTRLHRLVELIPRNWFLGNWTDRSEKKSVYSTNPKERSETKSVYSTNSEQTRLIPEIGKIDAKKTNWIEMNRGGIFRPFMEPTNRFQGIVAWARICKRLRSSRIDSKETIPLSNVA